MVDGAGREMIGHRSFISLTVDRWRSLDMRWPVGDGLVRVSRPTRQ